jgi:predicted alpha/beta superfamily hydrolase
MNVKRYSRLTLWLCAVSFVLLLVAQEMRAQTGAPVVIPRAVQYDLKSKITGITYRVMVATPFRADPDIAYPVFYVLDGNQYFGSAAEAMTRLSTLKDVQPAIVVGIGYPTEDPTEVTRLREFDLTPSGSRVARANGKMSGGGDAFLKAIEEEIKPFVAAHYKIDPTRQILYGHSLGGLMALRELFRNPTEFSTYILSSPSIWWHDKEVLADESAFSKRARSGELHLRIFITSGGDEPRGSMVDAASDLAKRLAGLNPKEITVGRTIFPDEIHASVSMASLNRGIRFALPPK